MKCKKHQKIRTEKGIELLMKSPGIFINIRNITASENQARKIAAEIMHILKMMNIPFQNRNGSSIIRVLTEEQKRAYEKSMMGTFSQRYGYKKVDGYQDLIPSEVTA